MQELRKAISLLGSQEALGKAVGLGQSAVANWLKRGTVPAEHCPLIELATAGQVTCEALRPDVAWDVLRKSEAQPVALYAPTSTPADTPANA
jgi:DNA-binding transcriptional regulator YdaS (Cro superfamily)